MRRCTITEAMRFRQQVCEYAAEYSVLLAAIKYNLNRQFVYRQLKKWDGAVASLALKSRCPHNSPNAHTEEELELIDEMNEERGGYGLAEVYVRYKRSYGSICRQENRACEEC